MRQNHSDGHWERLSERDIEKQEEIEGNSEILSENKKEQISVKNAKMMLRQRKER